MALGVKLSPARLRCAWDLLPQVRRRTSARAES